MRFKQIKPLASHFKCNLRYKLMMLSPVLLTALSSIPASGDEYHGLDIDKKEMEIIDKIIDVSLKEDGKTIAEIYTDLYTKKYSNILKNQIPDIDKRSFEIVEEETAKYINNQIDKENSLNKILYSVYKKYFTKDELKELYQFYSSDIGKKYVDIHTDLRADQASFIGHWASGLEMKIRNQVDKRLTKEIKIPKK
ncbi:MAG: DUF2059 domain-containing protein [Cellvibrionaceae bacterium]